MTPTPKFQKLPKLYKSYNELLKEAAKKNPKLYGSYVKRGKVEIIPKGFEYPEPIGEQNYFNRTV